MRLTRSLAGTMINFSLSLHKKMAANLGKKINRGFDFAGDIPRSQPPSRSDGFEIFVEAGT